MTKKYSNYVVYVDESGDHGLQTIDTEYPIFVLAFCIFFKKYYVETVVQKVEQFKFDNFGHDVIILHENEIRKEKGEFTKFRSKKEKVGFLEDLTTIIEESNFILTTCVIDKIKFKESGVEAENPYHFALAICLERLYQFLDEKNQTDVETHIVVERRGPKEDNELELEFRRICDGANNLQVNLPFDIVFADKKVNSAGLQLADLVARPVGLSVLRPNQSNRAFDVLKDKFYCAGGRENTGENFENWGLNIIPKR